MTTFWAFVRTVPGSFIKITLQAENSYTAFQMMKAMYGDQLISTFASPV